MPRWIATAQATASTALGNSHEDAVAHELDDAPAVLGDERLDELLAVRLEAVERAVLVALHQAGVADHVRRQDGGEPAVDAGSGQDQALRKASDGPMLRLTQPQEYAPGLPRYGRF